jgi:hypothetical protein
MNTAAVSSVTTIPPIHGHNRFFRFVRSTFNARPPDIAQVGVHRKKSAAARKPATIRPRPQSRFPR